jgi:hypothetical protein
MFDLSLFSFNSFGVRYGASKLFQILIPLLSYILIRDLLLQRFLFNQPFFQNLIKSLNSQPSFQRFNQDLPALFETVLGLMSWKIGCDLGFFLIVTSLGPWQRAFTWSGLIPYTVVQYFLYYLVGRKMLIEGAWNPFKPGPDKRPLSQRPSLGRRIFSKYFHEDLNATSENIPLRQVLLKPIVDYGGLVASWSLYTVGLFFIQSGEFNLAPVTGFAFFEMLTFYLVNTYGYILGFNLGELLYLGLARLEEWSSEWRRGKIDRMGQEAIVPLQLLFLRLGNGFDRWTQTLEEMKYVEFAAIYPVLQKYGLNFRWFLSASGGVLCVVLVAPGLASFMMSLGTSANQFWFTNYGHMTQSQLEQVQPLSTLGESLPPSELVISGFPEAWKSLYGAESNFVAPRISLKDPISEGSSFTIE